MSDNARKVLWTPNGPVSLGETSVDRVELKAGVIEWLRQFSDVAEALKLGIHCSLCGADLIGRNADSDRAYGVACGCRDFVGQNRDWRPSANLPLQ